MSELKKRSPDQAVLLVRKLVHERKLHATKPVLYDTPLHVDELLMNVDREYTTSSEKYFICTAEQAVFAAGEVAALGLPSALGYRHETDLFMKVLALAAAVSAEDDAEQGAGGE